MAVAEFTSILHPYPSAKEIKKKLLRVAEMEMVLGVVKTARDLFSQLQFAYIKCVCL